MRLEYIPFVLCLILFYIYHQIEDIKSEILHLHNKTDNLSELEKFIDLHNKQTVVGDINETIKDTAEVIKRMPNLPEVIDKANQALTFLASGQIPQNSNSYNALNTKKLEMIAFRNQSIIGLLVLVIFGLLVF